MLPLYTFIFNQWKLGKDEAYINTALEKGYITNDEKQTILASPQVDGK